MAGPHHHVPYGQPLSGNPVFGDESYGYTTGGFQHEQNHDVNFDTNWSLVDPSLSSAQHHGSSYGNSNFAQNWTAASTPSAHGNTFAPQSIYPQPFSSAPPFQNNFNYSSHGSPQFTQSLDPSLITPPQKPPPDSTLARPPADPNPNTISPAALQTNSPKPENNKGEQSSAFVAHQSQVSHPSVVVPRIGPVPKAKPSENGGKFLIINFNELSSAVPSKRMHNFLSVGDFPQDLPSTKSTVPQYIPRKSLNELRILAVSDPKLAAKLGKRVPKAPRLSTIKVGRPKAVASAASPESRSTPSESSSEYESSDSGSEYESELEENVPEPSPLAPTRPSEPLQAVRYDTMKAVWLPSNVPAQAEQIRSGLKDLWEVVKTIRDRWKSDSDAVKKATEAKKDSEIPLLKDRVKSQRNMMEMALRSALEHGHPDIVRLFGENKALMFLFYQFLAERIGEKDYSSSFVKIALQLLARCSTLTASLLEETKLNKVLLRFVKNAEDDVKALAQKVTDQAAFNSKSKIEQAKAAAKPGDAKKEDAKVKAEPPQKAAVPAVAGVKRSLAADVGNGQATKRIASSSVTPPGSNSAKSVAVQKKPLTASAEKTSIGAAASNASKQKVVSKTQTTNSLPSLPGQKKLSTSSNGLASAKKPLSAPVKVEKKVAPVSKPAFSFAETMASLNKPQEPEPSAKQEEESRPDETPEERAKRLRKEERRKLRVTWKPDAVLVTVRIFHHDPEEELGHDPNSVRDVGDINSEGRMFKAHKDAMDIDDDDDEQPMEQDYREWKIPSVVDFSGMPEDSRTNNYKRFGGEKHPESPETTVMQQHEASTLMAHYFTNADIPPCPKEPSDPYTGVHLETKIGESPGPNSVYTQRTAALAKPAVDVSAILQGLTPFLNQATSPPVQNSVPAIAPVPQMAPANDQFSALQNIFAQHTNPMSTPPQPHMGAAQPFQPPPQPAAPNPQVNALLAAFQAQSQPQAPPQAAPTAPPMFFPPAPAAGASPVPDPNALLAQLMNPQLLSMFAQTQNQGQTPPQPQAQPSSVNTGGHYEHPDRKRRREQDDHTDHKPRKGGKSKYRTVPCAFYKKGACKKGADCTYLHED